MIVKVEVFGSPLKFSCTRSFTIMAQVATEDLHALQAALLNTTGDVPLHKRFRALFTLKSLKTDEAIQIISKGQFDHLSTH